MLDGNAGTVNFQVGSEGTASDQISIDFTSDGTLGFSSADLGVDGVAVNGAATFAQADLDTALTAIDDAIAAIDTKRADFGAVQNRLESTISNLQNISENVSASRSRIMDTDYAAETANLTKNQIMQQAGTAMLSQANQLPQAVLSLLG